MMIWKLVILIAIFGIVSTERRFDMKNIESKTTEVKDWFKNVVDDQADAVTRARRKIESGFKSWIIIEPTERETSYVDQALCSMFSIGTDNLLDTMEKLDEFCRQRDTYLVEIAAWVIRKFTFHINIRVFMNIALNNIRKKTDLYCSDTNFKQNYVQFTQHLSEINNIKLNAIRFKFVDTLVSIQNSKIGITRVCQFCCGYWRYRNETLTAIDPRIPDLRAFIADMMDSFFGDSINTVCLPLQFNIEDLCSYYHGSHAEGQIRQSILMNMVEAISKITYIIF